MIQIYNDLSGFRNKEINEKIHNKLKEFIDYFMDWVKETNDLGEEWIYECIFPKFMIKYKKELCVSAVEDLSEWVTDEYQHKLRPIHEYALYKILQYCKSIDKEFLEEENRSLFGMEYNDIDYELKTLKNQINTFEFYEDICFEDYDFLAVATFYDMYKNNNVFFEQFAVDLDDYIELMPLDIANEYMRTKEEKLSKAGNSGYLKSIDEKDLYYKNTKYTNELEVNNRGENNMKKNPTVFISYSWDSTEHQEWVQSLVATLRTKGVKATLDTLETQNGTVNLNNMMVQNIRDNDYTIVVMTENYAKKADGLKGGVGRETTLLNNYIIDNTKKIIPILRSGENNAIPFYLQGLHYINFSDDNRIEESFNELLYRVLGQNKMEMPSVGQIPKLESKKIQPFDLARNSTNIKIDESLIPDFSKIIEPTELDKNRFIKKSYNEMMSQLSEILKATKYKNNIFDYDIDEIAQQKNIIRIYLNGISKYSVKLWLSDGIVGRDLSINLAYGNNISDGDGSMNEIIRCNVDKDKNLFLNITLSFTNRNEYMTSNEVVKAIWKQILDNI